jgi:cytochrome c oxidase accessory protein FixG
MACVNVCPVGIDIRDGQQLECITCALCIDACDEMMEKVGKPRGLIDYMALSDEVLEREGGKAKNIWKHIFRPRTVLYTTLWSLVGIGLVVALFMRSDIDLTVAPVRNPTFVTLSDGTIRNTYEVRLRNKHGDARPFQISVSGDETLEVSLEGAEGTVVTVPADEMKLQRVYVLAPPNSAAAKSERTDFRIWVEDTTNADRVYKDTVFNGKAN